LANGVGLDHLSEQDLGDLLILGREAGPGRDLAPAPETLGATVVSPTAAALVYRIRKTCA